MKRREFVAGIVGAATATFARPLTGLFPEGLSCGIRGPRGPDGAPGLPFGEYTGIVVSAEYNEHLHALELVFKAIGGSHHGRTFARAVPDTILGEAAEYCIIDDPIADDE